MKLVSASLQWGLLLQIVVLGLPPSVVASAAVPTVVATPFITSHISKFGLGIEGTSVDHSGNVYATGYSGDGTSGLGSIAGGARGEVMQTLLLKDQTASLSFNGIRFLPLSPSVSENFELRGLATDVKNHQVVHVLKSKRDKRVRASTFCGDSTMIQPNDIAVATKRGRIYLSGGNYGKVTTRIGDGSLWMCEAQTSFLQTLKTDLEPVNATKLGDFGLTNGIEISPDEKTLYLTESFQENGEPQRNLIWKFDMDAKTGNVYNKKLFVDFEKLDGTGHVNLDGMRTDVDGNLFVTKNGQIGETVKLSPSGELLLRIRHPGIFETTNVDFGGPDGKSLFFTGKCIDDPDKGCVDVWYGNSAPGRAWFELTSTSK